MKRIKIAAAASVAAITVSAAVITASADYSRTEASDGTNVTYVWDFAEYNEKASAQQDPKETTYAAIDPYEGLNIYLAVNNSADYVMAGTGVALGGRYAYNIDGSAGRYIEYTPKADGTLYVTGRSSKNNRWGIIDVLGGSFNADYSTNSTSETTVNMPCTAGKTYYIYGRDNGITVSEIKYVVNTAQSFTFETQLSEVKDKELYVTIGEDTKNKALSEIISDTVFSGGGELLLGIDFTHIPEGKKISQAEIK